jgi:hypothetical protein
MARLQIPPSTPPSHPPTVAAANPVTPVKTCFAMRPDYIGVEFKIRLTDAPKSIFSDPARQNISLDYQYFKSEELVNKNEELKRDLAASLAASRGEKLKQIRNTEGKSEPFVNLMAKHYGCTARSIYNVVNDAKERPVNTHNKSPGRPSMWTENRLGKLEEVYNDHKGLPSKILSNKFKGEVDWETHYTTQHFIFERDSPSPSSIRQMLARKFVVHLVRTRPFLSELAIAERNTFVQVALGWADENVAWIDEAYVESEAKKGKTISRVNQKYTEEDHTIQSNGGTHPCKIFLLGVSAKPRVLDFDDDGPVFDPLFNGKVCLFRVRGFTRINTCGG